MKVAQSLTRWRAALNAYLANALELRDVFWIAGLVSVTYGVAQVFEPAAWVVCGAVLFWMGVRR